MNKRIVLSILAGLSAAALFALITWLGGYNFDTRGFGIAYLFTCGVFISGVAARLTYLSLEGV